jgi:DNA mismatch repair protein MutS2
MKSSLEAIDWDRLCRNLALHAESGLGRELVAHLVPFRDREGALEAAQAVGEAMALCGTPAQPSFRELDDVTSLLASAHQRAVGLDAKELARVLKSVKCGEHVRLRLSGRADSPALQARGRAVPELKALVELLERTVDLQGQLLDEALPELGEVRRAIRVSERRVRELALDLAARADWRSVLRDGPPVLRDGRFMLAVKAEARSRVSGILHDRSASGESVFIEPDELVEPQNRHADLQAKERRLVDRILLERTRELLRHEAAIHEAQRLLASLDALFARARYGRQVGGTVVAVDADGPLLIERAHHPLLLEAGATVAAAGRVVPFDLVLGDAFDVLVISGPNTGGKTATLKAVGLLVAMALAAIPLPVAKARVPWFDAVHADIGDAQDIAQSLSTFSGHLRRIAEVLRVATRKSLVLLDELGTGTEPKEGEALGRALLLELKERGARVVATTHLSGLKDLGFSVPRCENASLEFDAETLQPLFRLTLGLPGESNALKIARRHGIPPPIVEAAEGFLHGGRGSEAGRAAEQASRARRAALDHLEGAEQERKRAEAMRVELERRIGELEAKANLLESEKEREIARVLERTRARGQELLAGLGTLPASLKPRIEAIERFLAELPASSRLLERRAAFLASRKRGDTVYLRKYREHCLVRKVDREHQKLTVLYRKMEVEIAFDEVQVPEDFEGAPG